MAIVLAQWFPLGRFHATRWNQNPFEDRFGEWPPSPWRLLRALAARWFQYQRETGDDDERVRDAMLGALAASQPAFWLPPCVASGPDLRQYVPTEIKFTKTKDIPEVKQPVPTLVRDRCRAIPCDEAILWVWEAVALGPRERELLVNLLRRMHYFGRAESWARFELLGEADPLPPVNCVLFRDPTDDRVPVLVPESTDGLMDVILARTGDSIMSHRPVPPGTAWRYAQLPNRPTTKPRVHSSSDTRLHVARYALDSTVLPLVTETLPVGEAARRALMSIHGRLTEQNGTRGRSAVLSGKDAHGNPLTGHAHAYYLPADEDCDGRLDHLTIFARDGFGPAERRALDGLLSLSTVREGEERHPLRLFLLGMGTLDEYAPGILQKSKVWVSATPYIATRYAKTRGRNRIAMSSPEARAEFLLADLRAQLAAVRPDVAGSSAGSFTIAPEWDENGVFRIPRGETTSHGLRAIEFKRFRSKPGDDGGRRLAGAFRIEFPTEVRGPIALGHSSHFGLGLFIPEISDGRGK